MLEPSLTLTPIGTIRTPFAERSDAPRQPGAGGIETEAQIVLHPGRNFEQALQDLEGFDLIWVISWFHKNSTWKTKVFPPRGERKRRGVFATRSPYRPNPIGLSLAKLVEIKGRTLMVRGIDLLDGTPILDLKPYIPYADSRPGARIGWLEAIESQGAFEIAWSDAAREQSEFLLSHGVDLEAPAARILRHDPTPHGYRRIAALEDGRMRLAIKSWRLVFRVEGSRVIIERAESGYAASVVAAAAPETLDDHAVHMEFHARWGT